MPARETWLHPSRSLVGLFGVVILLPASALILLGVRLLDQDRELGRQRQGEMLERAADDGVRALNQEFDGIRRLLRGFPPTQEIPEGAAWVSLTNGRFDVIPLGRIPYFPCAANLKEIPPEPFRSLESFEFADPPNLQRAVEMAASLTTSSDAAVRAGALLRQGSLLRRLGRTEESLAAYSRLASIGSVSVLGEPASLFARRARCAILKDLSRTEALRQEAEELTHDLRGGKWQLDRETYLHAASLLKQWTGSAASELTSDDEGLASAVAWLHELWAAHAADPASGAHSERWSGQIVTVTWAIDSGRASALLVNQRFIETRWLPGLVAAVAPARAYLSSFGEGPQAGRRKVERRAADTGLPWTLTVVAADDMPVAAGFAARRRNLWAGLAAVLVLVTAAGYFLWRAVNHEMAVARLQSEFVAAVSHEFRTPLTALRQFNDLLIEEDGPTSQKRHIYYNAQMRATERLHRLVESLLDFARMEAGRRSYEFESLDAAELAQSVTDEFQREAGAFGFTLVFRAGVCDHPVAADREALSRALWNLLENAMKYSGDSRDIEVEVMRMEETLSINVRDYGVGVEPAEHNRIFQKFVRGSAAKAEGIKGTGLGLAMVRHIINAHGGTVGIKSASGEGSTFQIVLPLRRDV